MAQPKLLGLVMAIIPTFAILGVGEMKSLVPELALRAPRFPGSPAFFTVDE